jgi:drug/metabolite transporter (DMT)-like permease
VKSNETRALLIAASGFICLATGDAIIKSMAGQWPGTAIAALRFLIGAIVLGALLLWREGRAGFAMNQPGIQLARGFSIAFSATCFFVAIHQMPLAEAAVITFISPIVTALLSAALLKEPAPKAAWIATIFSLLGVMLVLRPNFASVGLTALLPLGAAFGMSLAMVFNRMSAQSRSVLAAQFWMAAVAAPLLILAAVIGHSSAMPMLVVGTPSVTVILRCAIVGVTATMAHSLIYLATTRASAALIAPMTYVQLLVALLLGAIFFQDMPDAVTLAGSALIIGSGLYLWQSQRARA